MGAQETWIFDRGELTLERSGRKAVLTNKAAAVLQCLLRRKGKLVPRSYILREVWGGTHVTPDLVREYIFDLRTVMGDDPKSPGVIETVRGRGYRLIGDVRSIDSSSPTTPALARVAVFGFVEASMDDGWRRLASGLADDISTDLSRYPDIAVIARSAATAVDPWVDLPGSAKALGAKYLLLCQIAVRETGPNITIQLVEGHSAIVRWSGRYDCSEESLPKFIGEIANRVAGVLGGLDGEIVRLEADLVRRRPPSSLEAYEHYLLCAKSFPTDDEEAARIALAHAERATQLDPHLSRAWLRLNLLRNRAYICFGWGSDDPNRLQREYELYRTAAALDPRDPIALNFLALALAKRGKLSESSSIVERAADLALTQPNDGIQVSLGLSVIAGQAKRALDFVDRARELNPHPPAYWGYLECRAAFFAGDYERSVSVPNFSNDFLPWYLFRALSAAELGDVAEAVSTWNGLMGRFPRFQFQQYAVDLPIAHFLALQAYWSSVEKLGTIAGISIPPHSKRATASSPCTRLT